MNAAIHERAMIAIHDDPSATSWAPDVHDHVHGCESCRRTWEALTVMVGRLRARAQKPAPAALVADLHAMVHEHTEHHRAPAPRVRARVLVPAALAAGLALGVWIAPWFGRDGGTVAPVVQSGEVVRTVVDYLGDVNHDRYLLERLGRPLELSTADDQIAERWLSRGLGFELALGAIPSGYELEGARVWHTVSRLSAFASYRGEDHVVSVFAVPAEGIRFDILDPIAGGPEPLWYGEGWGFRGVAWLADGLAWSAVSTLDRDALVQWAQAYRQR